MSQDRGGNRSKVYHCKSCDVWNSSENELKNHIDKVHMNKLSEGNSQKIDNAQC